MLGLYYHSQINFISFCHHFPGVPVKSFTVKTEVKLSVCRGHNTSCGKCQDLHGKKKYIRTNKQFQPLCRTWTRRQCTLVWASIMLSFPFSWKRFPISLVNSVLTLQLLASVLLSLCVFMTFAELAYHVACASWRELWRLEGKAYSDAASEWDAL